MSKDLAAIDPMEVVEVDPKTLKGRKRNIQMFKDFIGGMPCTQIAAKYGVTRSRISKIKKDEEWEKHADKVVAKQYLLVSRQHRRMTADLTLTLSEDYRRLASKLARDPKYALTNDERTHVRQLLEMFHKSVRLSDDKPTDISGHTGVVEHRVILPPTAKRFGVIPPPSNVKYVIEDAEVVAEKNGLAEEFEDSE